MQTRLPFFLWYAGANSLLKAEITTDFFEQKCTYRIRICFCLSSFLKEGKKEKVYFIKNKIKNSHTGNHRKTCFRTHVIIHYINIEQDLSTSPSHKQLWLNLNYIISKYKTNRIKVEQTSQFKGTIT